MKLQYLIEDELVSEYVSWTYIPSENKFVFEGEGEHSLEYNPVLKLDTEYDPSHFQIVFLNNNETTENSIYMVEVKNNDKWDRIGWVFPIQALLSREHTQANNQFFLKYAYVASCLLLGMIDKTVNDETPEEFYLDDIFDADQNILVIDNDNVSKIGDFQFEKYIIGLYQYGYTLKGTIPCSNSLPISHDNYPGRIKIKKISDDISSIKFINQIIGGPLTSETSLVMRFHFWYQIIEILIQEIFNYEFAQLLGKLSTDPESLFDTKDSVNTISGEKQRVKMLFENYSSIIDASARNDLNNACIKLLSHLQRKVVPNVAYNLYAVRCLIVHKLYTLSAKSEEEGLVISYLSEINDALTDVLIDVLSTFHYRQVK